MSRNVAEILEDAMLLPAESRAAIAGTLIQSLDATVDPDAESAWAIEIAKRLKEIDSGAVTLIPWAEARQQILRSA